MTPPSGHIFDSIAPTGSDDGSDVAIIGDVHGCGASLEALLDRLDRECPRSRSVLVGDLFTKGDTPEVVVELMLARAASGRPIDAVCGNHDRRMLAAMLAIEHGAPVEDLPRAERRCLDRLERHGRVAGAREILEATVARVEIRDPDAGWTVLHAGIDPRLGLDGTPDEVKWSIKARPGERHWWDCYDGGDGLLVFGHKPVTAPMRRCVERCPVAVNVDTGCVYGGALTAYLVGEDRFLWVPGPDVAEERPARRTRPITREAARRDSTVPQEASAVPGRRPAGSS